MVEPDSESELSGGDSDDSGTAVGSARGAFMNMDELMLQPVSLRRQRSGYRDIRSSEESEVSRPNLAASRSASPESTTSQNSSADEDISGKPLTWTTGQRGNPKLCVGGFFYTFQRKQGNGNEDWQCDRREAKCRARATLTAQKKLIRLPKYSEHSHEAAPQKFHVLEARKKAKELGQKGTLSTGAVVREAYKGLSENAIALLPNEKSLKRGIQMQRKRDRKHPGIPFAAKDIPAELPDEFRQMEDGSIFLIADEKLENDRLLLFSTAKQLEILSREKHIFIDGTFKVVPSTHKQLVSVHVALNGDIVPVCYSLTSSFTHETYTRILRILKTLTGCRPTHATADFEKGIHNAIIDVFGIRPSGCLFHLAQCIIRRLQKGGHMKEYNEDKSGRLAT